MTAASSPGNTFNDRCIRCLNGFVSTMFNVEYPSFITSWRINLQIDKIREIDTSTVQQMYMATAIEQ